MAETLTLANPQQAMAAWNHVFNQFVKPVTMAGQKLRMTIKPESRRDAQNAHFHSLIGQISDHIGGDLTDKDDAKRILLSAFRIDTLRDPDLAGEWAKFGDMRIGRGLRGETVLLGNQTRDLTVKLASAFVEWLNAFGIEYGVQFKAPKSWSEI
jgi:hypothetical protein